MKLKDAALEAKRLIAQYANHSWTDALVEFAMNTPELDSGRWVLLRGAGAGIRRTEIDEFRAVTELTQALISGCKIESRNL